MSSPTCSEPSFKTKETLFPKMKSSEESHKR